MNELSLGVLLAESDEPRFQDVSRMLNELGHRLVAATASGKQAVATAREAEPDVAVLGPYLEDMSGLAAAALLCRQCPMPIVLLMDGSVDYQQSELSALGVQGWVPADPNHASLRAGLAAAYQGFDRINQLKDEVSGLSSALEERKLMERAKGLLMERFGLDEAAAREKLKHRAASEGASQADAARVVIKELTTPKIKPGTASGYHGRNLRDG